MLLKLYAARISEEQQKAAEPPTTVVMMPQYTKRNMFGIQRYTARAIRRMRNGGERDPKSGYPSAVSRDVRFGPCRLWSFISAVRLDRFLELQAAG